MGGPTSPFNARDAGRYLLHSFGITLAYYLLGRLGLLMVLPPYEVSPIYPAAGWGLAVLLVWGLRYLPAVALGSFLVQATMLGDLSPHPLPLALAISLGAAAQAAVGTLLVRRWCGHSLRLASPREVAGYLAAITLAGFVSPSCATLALRACDAIDAAQMDQVWTVWWTGDLMGVLIATPITLSLIGQPRSAWAARRLSVGLPMLLTTLLVGLGVAATMEWDRQRNRADFTRDANTAAQSLASALREPMLALEGIHGIVKVKSRLTREEFARATNGYLAEDSPLIALGLTLRVARADIERFNAAVSAEGLPGYTVRDRTRPGDVSTPPDEDAMAIRLVEPMSGNAGALGVNVRSIRGARAAVDEALRTGRPAASAGMQTSRDKDAAPGIVIYKPIYRGNLGAGEQALDGLVFATLRPDTMLTRLATSWPRQMSACLVDLSPDATIVRLGGRPGCEAVRRDDASGLPLVKIPLEFAGRHWEVRVYALPGFEQAPGRSWAFALVGLLATAMVGALLLLMTGHTQHVEALVKERTAALEREIANGAESERALRQSERRFRSIFETAPIGIVFADLNGGFQEVNAHFCGLVGHPADALVGRRSLDITHEDDRREDVRLARRLMRGEIPFYRRLKRYVRADGSIANARALVTLLRGSDGRPHRLVGVIEDITDQLRIEELDRAREAAEAANQAKNEFLSRMSHELRTPMNAILGFTQLMQMDGRDPLSAAQRNRADQITQAGWHLLEMINDTLDLSRIETGTLRLEPAALDVPTLLQQAQALVQQSATEHGVTLRQQLAPGALRLMGDSTRVTQILTNLLSNAIKYNLPGGSVSIEAGSPAPGWIEIAVRDTGMGLTDDQRAALFQPFNRLGRERSNLPGTGIGLVISRRLAEMMGGGLTAETVDGPGARFVLRLPAANEEAIHAVSGAAMPEEPAALRAGPHRRLLYVEDNPLNADVMRGILEQRPGLELEVATTIEAGVQALRERPPALVLLDWELPDGDGFALLSRLRELGGPQPPVVVVSANAQAEQMALAEAAGAHRYLTKPLDVRELLTLLDELLTPASGPDRAE